MGLEMHEHENDYYRGSPFETATLLEIRSTVDELKQIREHIGGCRKSLIALDRHGQSIAFNTGLTVIQILILLLILWRVW